MADRNQHTELNNTQLENSVQALLTETGFSENFVLRVLNGGANNRIFRLESNRFSLLLKVYFQDPHDRLRAEFSFARFAWDNGVRSLPEPIVCDTSNHFALYEFVPGRCLEPHEVNGTMVEQALRFYHEINRFRTQSKAQNLLRASEACFSIAEHFSCVEKRIEDLRHINETSRVDHDALIFVKTELSKAWSNVSDSVRRRCHEIKLPLESKIQEQDQRLSPSDFGFHNVIIRNDSRLCFIDFEYAGWDDPAKMVCDFFCQPAVPVPPQYHGTFANSIILDLTEPNLHIERIAMLLPVYQIKWCCIMLNEFGPTGSARRCFAKGSRNQEEEKAKQLEKARRALNNLDLQQSLKT